ncbi:hypothetical protein ACFX1R_042739 [Malus domestica]
MQRNWRCLLPLQLRISQDPPTWKLISSWSPTASALRVMDSPNYSQNGDTRAACRSIPTIMEIYNLDDVVTPFHLLTVITSKIRKNANVTNPKVIDMLLFKAMEELNNITEHAKQRRHIIGQYVVGQQGLMQNSGSYRGGANGSYCNSNGEERLIVLC